jgi:hypothetical protein
MSGVMRAVSDGIFRHQLEGFEKYPRGRDDRFLEVFNEHCISVDHARAVALTFREKMPMLQEVIDTALNLRPRFEAGPSQREEWEQRYGKPQPFDVSPLLEKRTGREIDRLWEEVLAFLRTTRFDGKGDIQKVHIGRCWQIAKHLGYKMNSHQQAEIDLYEHAYPKSRESLPVKRAAITEQDFKALASGSHQEGENRWD